MEPSDLCSAPGLGRERAAQVLAALELARRAQLAPDGRPRLRTAGEVYRYLAPRLALLRHEVFHVLSFNTRNVLLGDARVAEGTTDACTVDPREVFRAALAARATAVIFAHNHPSGDPEPSEADLQLTRELQAGARIFHLRVLDHVVVGAGRYVSLARSGLLHAVPSSTGEALTAGANSEDAEHDRAAPVGTTRARSSSNPSVSPPSGRARRRWWTRSSPGATWWW
jgi:DNA repair protein RadC